MSACAPPQLEDDAAQESGATYDVVINNGRVIDPETELDAIRSVGIRNGTIAEISATALDGAHVIDAEGLVVAPGFIDLHAHGQSPQSNEFQAHDGVTTALELELGVPDVDRWLKSRQDRSLINYGASASHQFARAEATRGIRGAGASANDALAADEVSAMQRVIEAELAAGGVGIGLPIGYVPGAAADEISRVFQTGAARSAPVFVHVRNPDLDSIDEAIRYAHAAGSVLHIMHINSMALADIDAALGLIEAARTSGLDVTTEMYPYTAGSTFIETAIFDEGWQERFGIGYQDLQWQETGERLTEQSFNEYRRQGGAVIMHMMKEEWLERSLVNAHTLIASDAMPFAPGAHPRSAGTFSRVLGRYVRDLEVLTLNQALEKMTLMPARRLEEIAPAAAKKGRIQVGMDADITVFDPATVLDQASFEQGLVFSTGIEFVLVNGEIVVDGGQTVANTFPGEPLTGEYEGESR